MADGRERVSRAPYGRRSVQALGDVPASAEPPTYYDRPVLKAGHWGFLVATYFFVGGIAGAAQVIASVVDLVGSRRDRQLVSAGRYLALAGALLSPVLLIADLQTPSRWYNMLRIYRRSSAMSIGSWTAAAQLAVDVFGVRSGRPIARWAGLPAAVCGAMLAAYSGTLLAATSVPLWSSAYRTLSPLFALSGTATASAALSLIMRRARAPRQVMRRLDRLSLLAGLAELALAIEQERSWQRAGVSAPLDEPALSAGYRLGSLGLGIVGPLLVHLAQVLTGRELPSVSLVAALSALLGGYCQRAVLVLGGRRSVERPRDYFHLTSSATPT
jgi:protein NrfD